MSVGQVAKTAGIGLGAGVGIGVVGTVIGVIGQLPAISAESQTDEQLKGTYAFGKFMTATSDIVGLGGGIAAIAASTVSAVRGRPIDALGFAATGAGILTVHGGVSWMIAEPKPYPAAGRQWRGENGVLDMLWKYDDTTSG
jgi:hypothetical protein